MYVLSNNPKKCVYRISTLYKIVCNFILGRLGRTVEEVQETLESVIIKESDLQNVTQILYSAKEHNIERNIKLLELDEHLIDTIAKGDR